MSLACHTWIYPVVCSWKRAFAVGVSGGCQPEASQQQTHNIHIASHCNAFRHGFRNSKERKQLRFNAAECELEAVNSCRLEPTRIASQIVSSGLGMHHLCGIHVVRATYCDGALVLHHITDAHRPGWPPVLATRKLSACCSGWVWNREVGSEGRALTALQEARTGARPGQVSPCCLESERCRRRSGRLAGTDWPSNHPCHRYQPDVLTEQSPSQLHLPRFLLLLYCSVYLCVCGKW